MACPFDEGAKANASAQSRWPVPPVGPEPAGRREFPVGHGADARAVAELTGAFVNEDPLYLQSTGFVLDPEGKVIVSVYSSGAIGRLVPEDVAGLVRYVREHAAARVPENG